MADRASASITIGGTLTQDQYATLAELIGNDRLSVEWNGLPFEPAHRIVGQPLALHAHEVPGAMFVELEAWCLAQGLPFVRQSSGYPGGWSPERVVFTGAGSAQSYEANDDDRVLISCETVIELGSYEAVLDHFERAAFHVPPLIVECDGDAVSVPEPAGGSVMSERTSPRANSPHEPTFCPPEANHG